MARGPSGKSHQKKIDRFKKEHPEGRKAFSKAKKLARLQRKLAKQTKET
jgi:hypothetical protein